MLTILSVPKPFKGHIATTQKNAIRSWLAMRPQPQVILFADEEGTAEAARELGVQHVPGVRRNENGTPMLDAVIEEGRRMSKNEVLCYINGDIILTGAFGTAVEAVAREFRQFLGVSKRINIDIREPIVFGADWEEQLGREVKERGVEASTTYIDCFVFPKSCYQNVPAFAVGRPWFDHWFIKSARDSGLPVVEMTPVAPLIHQNHDYGHIDGGLDGYWRSEETHRNLERYGQVIHDYTLADATHEIQADGSIVTKEIAEAPFSIGGALWQLLVVRTLPLRKRLGLRRRRAKPTTADR